MLHSEALASVLSYFQLDCDVVGVGVAPFIWVGTFASLFAVFLQQTLIYKEDEITTPHLDNFRLIFYQLESLRERDKVSKTRKSLIDGSRLTNGRHGHNMQMHYLMLMYNV
nr:hypothetical protein [Tanacetum cinerariifolium]